MFIKSIYLFLLLSTVSGCATNMLQHYIDGNDPKSIEKPGKLEEFRIVKVHRVAVYHGDVSMELRACLFAYFEEHPIGATQSLASKPENTLLESRGNEYELKISPFRPIDTQIANFQGIVPGCETLEQMNYGPRKFVEIPVTAIATTPAPPLDTKDSEREPDSAVNSSAHAPEYVAFDYDTKSHNYFYYITSSKSAEGKNVTNRYQIEVWPKRTDPKYKNEPTSGRKLLVVFIPITLAFDIVTSPFQLIFLMFNPPG